MLLILILYDKIKEGDTMYFLIGVIIFILFIIFCYLYIKFKIKNVLGKHGFNGMSLKDIIEEARIEDQEVPKSLSSMDSIYLEQIKKDFIDININELKREAEKIILDSYKAIETKDSSKFSGKIKSFIDKMISDYKDEEVRFKNFKIHNTVVARYKKEGGVATIYFSSSYEYFLERNGKSIKTQDRARTEFIYIYDEKKLSKDIKAIGLHCPNCGSPITSLGEKSCSYCGTAVKELIKKIFVCNDIVRY